MLITMALQGSDALAAKLRDLAARVEKQAVGDALLKGAEPIRGMAAATMPRSAVPHGARAQTRGKGRHGAMGASHAADHIAVALGKSKHSIAIGPGPDWWYWLFNELGTVRRPANPVLRRAFESQAPRAVGIVQDELWTAIADEAEGPSPGGAGLV